MRNGNRIQERHWSVSKYPWKALGTYSLPSLANICAGGFERTWALTQGLVGQCSTLRRKKLAGTSMSLHPASPFILTSEFGSPSLRSYYADGAPRKDHVTQVGLLREYEHGN